MSRKGDIIREMADLDTYGRVIFDDVFIGVADAPYQFNHIFFENLDREDRQELVVAMNKFYIERLQVSFEGRVKGRLEDLGNELKLLL